MWMHTVTRSAEPDSLLTFASAVSNPRLDARRSASDVPMSVAVGRPSTESLDAVTSVMVPCSSRSAMTSDASAAIRSNRVSVRRCNSLAACWAVTSTKSDCAASSSPDSVRIGVLEISIHDIGPSDACTPMSACAG